MMMNPQTNWYKPALRWSLKVVGVVIGLAAIYVVTALGLIFILPPLGHFDYTLAKHADASIAISCILGIPIEGICWFLLRKRSLKMRILLFLAIGSVFAAIITIIMMAEAFGYPGHTWA